MMLDIIVSNIGAAPVVAHWDWDTVTKKRERDSVTDNGQKEEIETTLAEIVKQRTKWSVLHQFYDHSRKDCHCRFPDRYLARK